VAGAPLRVRGQWDHVRCLRRWGALRCEELLPEFVRNGEFLGWFSKKFELVPQAKNQVSAAGVPRSCGLWASRSRRQRFETCSRISISSGLPYDICRHALSKRLYVGA
jgi:hypothetical protein